MTTSTTSSTSNSTTTVSVPWYVKLWNWLFSSSTANSATVLLAQGAGTAAAIAIINNVDKNNKSGTAADVLSIADAVNSLLTGTIPTNTQISTVMANLKSNSSTTTYALIAQQFLTAFQDQLTAWSGSGVSAAVITQYAKAFITGLQTGAALEGKA